MRRQKCLKGYKGRFIFIYAYKELYYTRLFKHTSFSMSLVLEWQIVTVALCHKSKLATGAPTILLRPNTTALVPEILIPLLEL